MVGMRAILGAVVIFGLLWVAPSGATWLAGWMRADAADQVAAGTAARAARAEKPRRALTAADGWDPIAIYDPNDKRLDIDVQHLPADALLCIGTACDLVAGWQARGPK